MTEKRARRMVRGWEGVRPYFPYGRTQLQQMVAEGRFPKPIKIGPRAIAFFEDEILAAQEQLARQRASDDSSDDSDERGE
jgi:predicted DNA-binding transcriptional regulator AlpA